MGLSLLYSPFITFIVQGFTQVSRGERSVITFPRPVNTESCICFPRFLSGCSAWRLPGVLYQRGIAFRYAIRALIHTVISISVLGHYVCMYLLRLSGAYIQQVRTYRNTYLGGYPIRYITNHLTRRNNQTTTRLLTPTNKNNLRALKQIKNIWNLLKSLSKCQQFQQIEQIERKNPPQSRLNQHTQRCFMRSHSSSLLHPLPVIPNSYCPQ